MCDKDNYINDISKHMINNNVALFIGAGFSNIFGYPSWGLLLNEIIDENEIRRELRDTNLFSFITQKDYQDADEINDLILDKLLGVDYLRLAGYINYLLEKNKNITIHQAVIDKINSYEQKRVKNDDIAFFFGKYKNKLNTIITTNYDTNIEFCFNNQIDIIHRNLSSLNNLNSENKLFKIHGCITDENSTEKIIITEHDYNNFKKINKYMFYKIYSFFTEKKIVFMGYSINDPNIRSLLNDVIEENSEIVELGIYWVTRDKLNEIDKNYYESEFGLKIIEEIEIVEFFQYLDERVQKNNELIKAVEESLEHFCEKLILNYDDQSYIDEIKTKNNEKDILQYLYNKIQEGSFDNYIETYFTLLTQIDEYHIHDNQMAIQSILRSENKGIFNIVELCHTNDNVLKTLKNNSLSNLVINTLVKYSNKHHSFGIYAKSIKYLLISYKNFREEVQEIYERFMSALYYNISKSTSHNQRYYGYDWYGLSKVKKYMNFFEYQDLINLLEKMTGNYIDKIQSLQIFYVIKYSKFEDDKKRVLKYEYLYQKKLSRSITLTIRSVLNEILIQENNYKEIKHNNYRHDESNISIEKTDIEKYITSFKIIDKLRNKTILEIREEFDGIDIVLYINEEVDRFKKYGEFKKEKFKDIIKKKVDTYISSY